MYKVLFMISQFHKGGAESSLANLLKKMDPKQFDIDFIIMNQVPVAGTVSLVDEVPAHVHLCNVFVEEQHQNRIIKKVYFKALNSNIYSEKAISFVQGKVYDVAIHVGEWRTPEFMAYFVQAKRKVVWFHADIDKSTVFNPDAFFSNDGAIDYYLFVSQHSMESSCKKYPFIKSRSFVLHNCIDCDAIVRDGNKLAPIKRKKDKPLVVTVANIRTEKNHLRALEAMKILQKRGMDFTWWNVGHKSVPDIVQALENGAKESKLDKDYLLMGAYENPYPLLKQADALACLSDFESWSLVITEARCLGVPIVATKTSGAIEQISNGNNGVLVDFTAESIADGLEKILFDKQFNTYCKEYLRTRDSIPDPLVELQEILKLSEHKEAQKSILYVIDDVNYQGGAHHAAFQHMRALQKNGMEVSVYSPTFANARVRSLVPGVHFFSYYSTREYALLSRRALGCYLAKDVTKEEKDMRMMSLRSFRQFRDSRFVEGQHEKYIRKLASQFDVVCLLSEGSRFKKLIAESKAKKKIQWIHTDYCMWSQINDDTKNLSKEDGEIWKSMDKIVVLSKAFEKPLAQMYPHLKSKITSIGNLQPVESILKKADEKIVRHLNVVCVLDERNAEEEGRKILDALMEKKKKMHSFYWVIVGLPFETLEDYPKLNDSVTCVPSMKCVDPDLLLMQKDILIAGEEQGVVTCAARRSRIPFICVTNKVAKMEKTDEGWRLPTGIEPVTFVWENMLAISNLIEDIKNVHLDERGQLQAGYDKPLRFASCFRFEPVKNVTGIIRVLGRLLVGGVRFHWTFIGDGEQYGLAKEMVAQYRLEDHVTFIGRQTNPFPYIRQSDVFVQFSRYEGLPNTIYEALILGIPVLASNVGAIADQITSDDYGWLIEPKEDALAAAVTAIASDPEKVRMMKTALKQYRYDNESVEKKLVKLFMV